MVLQCRAVDTHQLRRHLGLCFQRVMNTLCESRKVGINCTDHNPSVLGRSVMQLNEMASIERQHDPLLRNGIRQDVRVSYCPTTSATFRSGQDIVAQVP